VDVPDILLKDSDWRFVEDALCRVIKFTPMLTTVNNNKVVTTNINMPYAAVHFECKISSRPITGYISHKVDFRNLWAAFRERGIQENEEVLFIWSKQHYKNSIRLLFIKSLPSLWIMVCPQNAFELISNRNYRPDLAGEARYNALRPIVEWKPDVMD